MGPTATVAASWPYAGGTEVDVTAYRLYRDGALLRSVAVDERFRGRGLGGELMQAAIELAERLDVTTLFLLTTTAERFFPKHGFAVIDREQVPPSVRTSIEFTSACPASAVVMMRPLDRPSVTHRSSGSS